MTKFKISEKLSARYNSNYKYSLLCGLTGSAAALFAKEGLQQDNGFYTFIMRIQYGWILSLIFRCIFFAQMVFSNAKMIEYKIRSFAAIGSSMTVVAAFQANYAFNMLYEIQLYFKFPSMNQYIGSIFCLAGVFVLRNQIVSDKEQSNKDTESTAPEKTEISDQISNLESKCDVVVDNSQNTSTTQEDSSYNKDNIESPCSYNKDNFESSARKLNQKLAGLSKDFDDENQKGSEIQIGKKKLAREMLGSEMSSHMQSQQETYVEEIKTSS